MQEEMFEAGGGGGGFRAAEGISDPDLLNTIA